MLLARPDVVLSRGAPGVVVWSLCCSCLAAELGDFACTITTNRHFNWEKNIEMVCNRIFRLLKLYTAHKDPLSEFAAYLQELKESKPATCSIYIPIAYNQGVYSIVIYCHILSYIVMCLHSRQSKQIRTTNDQRLAFPHPKLLRSQAPGHLTSALAPKNLRPASQRWRFPWGNQWGKQWFG